MELEIAMFKKRVYLLLDDGWYILNDINETADVILDVHNVTVMRKNGVNIVYYEDALSDDKTVPIRVFDKDGFLVHDTVNLSYEELKEASKRIVATDKEGSKFLDRLNGKRAELSDYVEYKGGKTND